MMGVVLRPRTGVPRVLRATRYSLRRRRIRIACDYDGNHYYYYYYSLFSEWKGDDCLQFNDGNHFGGCVDDVDGVVILIILLSGQRKSEKGDSFPIEKRI